MTNIENPRNVVGMGELLADDDEDLNIDDLEKSITTGVSIKKESQVDFSKEYAKEIEDFGSKFNITTNTKQIQIETDDDDVSSKELDELLNYSPYNKPSANAIAASQPTGYKPPYNLVDDDNYYPSSNSRPADWPVPLKDDQLNRMTNEERKQDHVNRVLGNIEKIDDDAEFVEQEDEEDEMARIMEQIDLLRSNLESEGVDLSRIPDVNSATSKKEAKAVLRILQIKNDRLRYCDFFEEGILALAYGLESIFNGQREILGSRIDLTGYSDTVKVKLRRMRYDTSNFVSSIMQGYNIGSGWRIALELIPSLFLYSRDRKMTAKDSLYSDESYKKAIQDIPN